MEIFDKLLEINESYNTLYQEVARINDPELTAAFLHNHECWRRLMLQVDFARVPVHNLEPIDSLLEDYTHQPTSQLELFPEVRLVEVPEEMRSHRYGSE